MPRRHHHLTVPVHGSALHHFNLTLTPTLTLYVGTTTTCESLYMGVPCITLAGSCHAHNVGVSLLKAVGIDDGWVAHSEDEYVQLAVRHAADLPRLAEVRAALRPQMLASIMCDAKPFIRKLEDCYRTMWHTWLERPQAESAAADDLALSSSSGIQESELWPSAVASASGLDGEEADSAAVVRAPKVPLPQLSDSAAARISVAGSSEAAAHGLDAKVGPPAVRIGSAAAAGPSGTANGVAPRLPAIHRQSPAVAAPRPGISRQTNNVRGTVRPRADVQDPENEGEEQADTAETDEAVESLSKGVGQIAVAANKRGRNRDSYKCDMIKSDQYNRDCAAKDAAASAANGRLATASNMGLDGDNKDGPNPFDNANGDAQTAPAEQKAKRQSIDDGVATPTTSSSHAERHAKTARRGDSEDMDTAASSPVS